VPGEPLRLHGVKFPERCNRLPAELVPAESRKIDAEALRRLSFS
jgi:hypothetical protein